MYCFCPFVSAWHYRHNPASNPYLSGTNSNPHYNSQSAMQFSNSVSSNKSGSEVYGKFPHNQQYETQYNYRDEELLNPPDKLIYFADESSAISIIWQQEYIFANNKSIQIDLNNDGQNEIFELGMDVQSGTRVRVILGNIVYDLLSISSLKNNTGLFDNNGDVLEGYYAQASFYDFDGDGKPEIIVAIGDKSTTLGVSIFKYTEAQNIPFEEIGYIEGQQYIYINRNNQILVPYGTQGLFSAYRYENGRIVEIDPSEYIF